MLSREKKQRSPPGIPYDQRPYTYYADKFLPKNTSKKYWGLNREDAVEVLAEAMEGTPHAALRLFELKGAAVLEGDFVGLIGIQRHEKIYLSEIDLRSFACLTR